MQPTGTTSAHLVAVRLKSANRNIFRAVMSLASAALLLRVMGMLNQIVVTARFGLGAAMDAYFVASLVPSLLAQLIGSSVEYAVVPEYIRIRSQEGKKQASELFSTLLNIVLIGTILLMLAMFIFRYQIIRFSAPSLDPSRTALAVGLTPFIFPVLLLMVLISLLESILNAEGQFGWPAYAGMLVPLTTAIFVVVAGLQLGVVALCVGTVVGLCLQLCAFFIRIQRAKLVYRAVINLRNPAVRSILILAWPALLTALIIQAGPLVDQIFASSLSAGSISELNYALKLNSVPVGIIFVSFGRAALPYLSYQVSTNDMKSLKETLRLYLWAIVISTLLLSAFMIILAHPLVQILFQRGAFTADDTSRTASTVVGFTIGLTPMSFGFIISKVFNALGKTRILMYVTIFSVTSNAIFDYIFARLWQSTGIALATSAVYFCTMFILLFALRRTIGKLDLFTPPGEVLKVIWKLSFSKYYIQWIAWKDVNLSSFGLSYDLRQWIVRIGTMIIVFIAGVISTLLNSLFALRAAIGSVIILAFLRYPYALLIAWALINAFIGSNVQFFNGNNFLSGLTVPTLLLMFCLPIRQTFKRMPTLIFLSLYLLWVFAGIRISAIGAGSFLTLWITFLDYVAIAVLTINLITTQQRMHRLIDAILIPATFISLYGIYGYFTRQNGVVDITSVFRIYSIYNAAPGLALLLSIIIPLAIYRTFTLRGYKRIGGLILILVFLMALGLTFARGAYISVPVSIIIMIFFLPSRKLRIGLLSGALVFALLLVLLATMGNVPIFDRFLNQDLATFNGRTYLWQALLDHFDPTQLLGNGLQASNILLTNLRVGSIATASSNLFIGTLYDHGIIGVILLALVFIALFTSLIVGIRKATGGQRMLYAAALAAFVNMLFQSQESNDFWTQAIGIYFWIIMALPFALYWSTAKKTFKNKEVPLDEANEETVPRMKEIKPGESEQVVTV